MRIIEYPIILRGGYCLLNDPDATSTDDEGNPDRPGIQMAIMERHKPEKIANTEKSKRAMRAFFYENCDKDYNFEFEKHLCRALQCEDPLWKIASVIISSNSLRLELVSEQLCNEHYRKTAQLAQKCNDNPDDDLPRYREYVSADGVSLSAVMLRFEIPPTDDYGINVVEVNFSACGFVTVIEYDKHRRRRCYEIHSDKEEVFHFPAIVTEYM